MRRTVTFAARVPCLALLAAATVLPALPARAQMQTATAGVQMFDEAPSLDQLRSILVLQSPQGATRSIVLTPPAAAAATRPSPVQAVALHTGPLPAMPPAHAAQSTTPPPVAMASSAAPPTSPPPIPATPTSATPAPAAAPAAAAPAAAAPAAGAVGFRINFAFDSDVIPPSARPFIDQIGVLLHQESGLKLRIEGHTDAQGDGAYNLDLSRRRGLAVASYLAAEDGIAPDRLQVVGMGKSAPLLDDAYDPRNRRVQFARID